MSFILDALKKSESDRQRQSGPSLFEVKVTPPRRTLPVWALAIAVLLGINVVVISWMLLRRPAAPQPAAASGGAAPLAIPGGSRASGQDLASGRSAPASAAVNAGGPGPAANRSPPVSSENAPSSAANPASSTRFAPSGPPTPMDAASAHRPAAVAPPPAADANPDGGSVAGSGDPSDYAQAVEPAAAPDSGAPAQSAGSLPLYQQIVGSAGLPSLHLDLHVFADRPQDRFAMINMHRVGEGDSLPNGAHVEAIRPDGVVLSYHGTRFLLPRS